MPRRKVLLAGGLAAGLVVAMAAQGAPALANGRPAPAKHVLLLSADGMHQADLTWYVRQHPHSALAALVHTGRDYTNASTTFPSDSFPGMVAQLTGADPGTSGVYYDDTFNHALLPAGTTDCGTAATGAEVALTEAADRSQNPITLDAGQGIPSSALGGLPTNSLAQTLAAKRALTAAILRMTPKPAALLSPAALPVDPSTCTAVVPHQYIRTNTVFEVAKQAGLRTAWSDKHPAYEILNGPSGSGVDDLFTPEINSVADAAGDDWTTDNALTAEYDSFKVAAVVNEIRGYDHSGMKRVGTPAILGMNLQTVSTAQKLPASDGLQGGYTAAGTPGPLLQRALAFVNGEVSRMVTAIHERHLQGTTTIVLSAKHGQSPIDPAALRRVDDAAIIDAIDAGWASGHPGTKPLVTFSVDDDVMLLWLSDRSTAARSYASHFLLSHSAPANRITDAKGTTSTTVASSGLTRVLTGKDADRFVGARAGDPHAPDLIGLVRYGVVYTGGVKKIAEHGGDATADRHVPLVVSGAGVRHGSVRGAVETTQIAPTILALLGLDPRSLKAVRIDHTAVLAGVIRH
ncbi:alkaline phosphatase family protein [Amnibacterium sp.]|uniref:alkaline phosphatase family protein n=1 Tax=Amnibacterium sp. TaxID=1872496 RepID=UPI00261F78DD|nr:alkaline phosphatase family protein [Amnibacterium sp.]